MSIERRLRRRHRQRWSELEKARMWISVFADGLTTSEAATLHNLHGATGRSARSVIAEVEGTTIPALAADLRARQPAARVDDLAYELLDRIAAEGAARPKAISAAEAQEAEERTERALANLARRWGVTPDQIVERLGGWRGEEPATDPAGRADQAIAKWLALVHLSGGGSEPSMPERVSGFDPQAHEKYIAWKRDHKE